MKQCPICQYRLEPFESTCPRCRLSATQGNAVRRNTSPSIPASTQATLIAPNSVKTASSTATVPAAREFSWLPGALAAGATFFVPAVIFAISSVMVADVQRRARADNIWLDIIFTLAPWLGGIGGYIASAYGKFWFGVSAGLVLSVLWCLLCRAMGDATASNTDFALYLAIFSLLAYECAAILGGVKRVQQGLSAVDGFTTLTLFIGLLCFALPIPGIIATTFLTRSDSDYRLPALYGTIAGIGIWALVLAGAALSSTMR